MTNTPQTSADQNDPLELHSELDALWRKELNLQTTAAMSQEQRNKIYKLLGKEGLEKVPFWFKTPPEVIEEIYQRLVSTRSALAPHVDIKNPENSIVTLSSGSNVMKNLVRDPASKEAQMVVWFINNAVGTTSPSILERAFKQFKNTDIQDLVLIKNIHALYETLVADSDLSNLGASNSTTGTGRIGKAREKFKQLKAVIDANPPGSMRDREKLRQYHQEVVRLQQKRTKLEQDLEQMNLMALQIAGDLRPTDMLDDITGMARNFSPDAFPDSWKNKFFSKDAQKSIAQRTERIRKFGTARPPASAVLDDLIREHFEPKLALASGAEKEKFYAEMRKILKTDQQMPASTNVTSSTTSVSSGSTQSSTASSASAVSSPQSSGGSLWQKITNSWLWKKAWETDPIIPGFVDKKK